MPQFIKKYSESGFPALVILFIVPCVALLYGWFIGHQTPPKSGTGTRCFIAHDFATVAQSRLRRFLIKRNNLRTLFFSLLSLSKNLLSTFSSETDTKMLFFPKFLPEKYNPDKEQINRTANLRMGLYRFPCLLHFPAPVYIIEYQY